MYDEIQEQTTAEDILLNIFYLDEDQQTNAIYHMDKHIVKMPTEVTQMLTTAIWVDKFLGFVPRKLEKDELSVINKEKAAQPSIEERTFTRFLPAHINHPCTIWVRSSAENYEWAFNYCAALNEEYRFRYRHEKNHKSYDTAAALPELSNLPNKGLTIRPMCMPVDYQDEGSVIDAYRMYYMMDKAPFAVWKRRFKPSWWNEDFAEYGGMDPHQSYLNTVAAGNNKKKSHGHDYDYLGEPNVLS